jgi:hypothetical protein
MLLNKTALIKNQLFTIEPPYRGGAVVFLVGGMVAFYLSCIVATLGVLYTAILLYVMLKKIMPYDWAAKAVWVGGIVINFLVAWSFFVQNLFLANRYVGLLGVLLLLAVPFGLIKLAQKKWTLIILLIWLFIIVIGDVGHFGPSKTYIVKGGKWIAQNTLQNSSIYSNDAQLFYYTQRQGILDDGLAKFDQSAWSKVDYVVVKIRKDCVPKECALATFFEFKPLQEFHNKNGDKVLIYKIK